jgi:hypothetical protein
MQESTSFWYKNDIPHFFCHKRSQIASVDILSTKYAPTPQKIVYYVKATVHNFS